jgi:predicted acetyltransferase
MNQLTLRELTINDEAVFLKALSIPSDSSTVFALGYKDSAPFKDYLQTLEQLKADHQRTEGLVPSTLLFGFVDGEIIGRLSIRHHLNPALMQVGGHVGYITLSPFRGRGYAKEMLAQGLRYCRNMNLKKILLTCDTDNIASVRTIAANGGILEDTRSGGLLFPPNKSRFWIAL